MRSNSNTSQFSRTRTQTKYDNNGTQSRYRSPIGTAILNDQRVQTRSKFSLKKYAYMLI